MDSATLTRSAIRLATIAATLATILMPAGWAAAQGASPAAPSGNIPVPSPSYRSAEMLKEPSNPVVAEVDGHSIFLSEVGDAVRVLPANKRHLPFDEVYPNVLERLIQRQALVAKARRLGLDADLDVKRQMQMAVDSVLERAALDQLAARDITERAVAARYQRDYADRPGPHEVDLRIVLLPTEAQARQVVAELAGGADFAAVARRDSKDGSALQGGSLGFKRQDMLIPELGGIAFALEPGQVSPNPVATRAGWLVVRVEARRRGPVPPYGDVRARLRRELVDEASARLAREAVMEASVRRFNINGTPLIVEEGQRPRAGAGR